MIMVENAFCPWLIPMDDRGKKDIIILLRLIDETEDWAYSSGDVFLPDRLVVYYRGGARSEEEQHTVLGEYMDLLGIEHHKSIHTDPDPGLGDSLVSLIELFTSELNSL